MDLEDIVRGDGIVRVALFGSLDAHGTHAIDVRFHGCTAARRRPTIVDLTRVDYLNSLGIGMLVAVGMSLKRHGAAMVLVCPRGPIVEVLEAASLQKFLPIVGTVCEAETLLAAAAACDPLRSDA
jgi:anti-anti-sigma factor